MKLFIQLVAGLVVLTSVTFMLSTQEQKSRIQKRFKALLHSERIPEKHIEPSGLTSIKTQAFVGNSHSVACHKAPSSDIDKVYKVYQWEDENSRTQISDKPPRRDYTKLRIKNLHVDNFFKLSMNTSQAVMPAFTKDRVGSGVKKVYKTLANVIKVAEIRSIQLSLRFISDKLHFMHIGRK